MRRRTAVLFGIAGRPHCFLLSLYNLKAFALSDVTIRRSWKIVTIQKPYVDPATEESQLLRFADEIVGHDPAVVAMSCYMWNTIAIRKIARVLRMRLPNTVLVWGGPEMTRDYLSAGKYDTLDMDFCVSGEGEVTFAEFLRTLDKTEPDWSEILGLSYRTSATGDFRINPPRPALKSLLEIPSPFLSGMVDDETLRIPKMQANIETQRGCNLRCAYCVYHKDMSTISYSEAQRTIDEVTYVVNKGVSDIRFVDANFGSSLPHAKSVMKGLIAAGIEARLMFELIPGFIDEELAELFGKYITAYEANDIKIGVGVQSINIETLRRLRRAIKIEQFQRTFEMLQRHDVYMKVDIIVGLPGEDAATIAETLEYMINSLGTAGRHLLCCHIMRGLPGTQLLEIAKADSMVFSSPYDVEALQLTHDAHELLYSPLLPRQDAIHTWRRAAIAFWLVNHAEWCANIQTSGLRTLFFQVRNALQVSSVDLIDRMITFLLPLLRSRGSEFADHEFPRAETWWWQKAATEIGEIEVKEFLLALLETTYA